MLDDDKRQTLLMQERLFEDGDLHIEGQRKRNFRWNDQPNEDHFTNFNLSDESDEDDDAAAFADEGVKIIWKPIETSSSAVAADDDENSNLDEFLQPAEQKPTATHTMRSFGGPVNSIL